VVVLRPRGRAEVRPESAHGSPEGWTELRLPWRVLRLWRLPAERLLATGEPGLMPWVPLAQFQGEPGPVLERCRAVIEAGTAGAERSTLLTVTQVLTRLRYNDPGLLKILGGRQAMIESPLLDGLRAEFGAQARAEGRAEGRAEAVVLVLARRFGSIPPGVEGVVRATRGEERLDDLLTAALECESLAAFEERLRQQRPAMPPTP